jgi:hypothetical protein
MIEQPKAINAAFIGTPEDKEYVPHLKGMFNGLNTFVTLDRIELLTHLELYCGKRAITRVVSTSVPLLQKFVERSGSSKLPSSISDYAGSLFEYKGIEVVFISPLKQLFTVPHGKFLAARFISKVAAPESWAESTTFTFSVLDSASKIEAAYHDLSQAYAIAVDIETFKNPLSIRCIGYTGVFISSTGVIATRSYILPIDSTFSLAWMRKINALPIQKIFQNGKYDCSYLLRYNAPVTEWYWDTAHYFHSWYSELPKDLAFLNAFFLRKVVYWKDLAETNDLFEYYKYNALDTWATANVWIRQLIESPDWVRWNYTLEFPLVYPCLLAEMTGLKRDHERLIAARTEVDNEEATMLSSLQKMLGAPTFNPGSSQQVVQLLKLLGCGDITSSGVNEVAKAKLRHPLVGRILSLVSNRKDEDATSIRGLRKLRSNYLRLDGDGEIKKSTGQLEKGSKDYHGRILYALNPHGTDTGRLASREHHFWTGLQIQNIPVGKTVKQTICSDEGFYLGECDLEQAESRDTANIVGETDLIAAVSGTRDFHSVNASAFFGRPYESIYDDSARKTKDKPLRDLSKRTNHGANYNMGSGVIVDTMGLDKIWMAKKLLQLPYIQPEAIGEHLLTVFHLKYPKIRGSIAIRYAEVQRHLHLPTYTNKLFAPGTYYASVAYEVTTTRRIVSRAFHHTELNLRIFGSSAEAIKGYVERGDWTRFCFGKPDSNKLDLNSLVAHCPQSLNARTLNEAFLKVFYEVALPNPSRFRLHAQIHDSILFSYQYGYENLANQVRSCMEIPVTVRDISGTYRTFTVPAALKLGKLKDGTLVRAKYWSETE